MTEMSITVNSKPSPTNEIVDQWAQMSSGPPGFNSLGPTSPNHPSYADWRLF
jgi:hypothetical protein